MQNTYDGTVAQREDAVFGLITEVHGKGLFQVITDVPAAINASLSRQPTDCRYVGPWTAALGQKRTPDPVTTPDTCDSTDSASAPGGVTAAPVPETHPRSTASLLLAP